MPFTNDRAWEDEVREISGYPDIEYPKQNPDESDDDYMAGDEGIMTYSGRLEMSGRANMAFSISST